MKSYSRTHLSDGTLLSDARTHLSQDRTATAELLADLAEIEERRAYAAIGFPSMHAYCVQELHLSDDEAAKRIHAARTARKYPAIFRALAEGQLHMTAVNVLATYLTAECADDLLAASTHSSKSEIQLLLAQRFPRSDVPALMQPLARLPEEPDLRLSPGTVEQHAPERVESPARRSRISPLAPQRFALQLTIGQSAHDKLRHARELLGHQIPSGDLAEVLERLLDLAIPQLEKRKFAATSKPRKGQQHPAASAGHIPASVQRAVWQRDGGQCTFVSENGRRCAARGRLEFDHIQEVARGGQSTIGNVRLLCRAHNQYQAEQIYGPAFMKTKREDSARAAAKKRVEEVIPYLRALGCSPGEARRAAQRCESIPDAPLEERVRLAVSQLGPRGYSARRAAGAAAGHSPSTPGEARFET